MNIEYDKNRTNPKRKWHKIQLALNIKMYLFIFFEYQAYFSYSSEGD